MTSIPPCTAVENCTIPTDIVLVSSDGERFSSHTKNLGEFTGSFPADIPPGEREEVLMKNLNAKALGIFLRFVHHHRHPDLGKVDFDTLSQLAEAVEMYEVYSAMEFCKMHMSAHILNHALDVLLYSVKHGYMDVADQAAENVVGDRGLSRSIVRVLAGSRVPLSSPWRLLPQSV
ncbi:hypothetical protein CPC08DRAFT_537444 [Agrocybe pediades]|nr:hypothetical protein CPC08DRAFT_537444 [Agrocybe pediades]